MSSLANSRLETDRYGVPQYDGQPDAFEEYQERAWDLFHGRDGSDQLQVATAVHLRAGLTLAAYEAVRKISHDKLKNKDSQGKATTAGVQLFLETLRENIAAEAPLKVGELFMTAFYSPTIWRQPGETMQQYIVRRDQEFRRLEEVPADAKVPEHLQAIMLLTFGGLENREQLAVLSSVGNEYSLKKIGHALRIQYPNAAGKPITRKDFLGASRGQAASQQYKAKGKGYGGKTKGKTRSSSYAFMGEEDEHGEGDDVYYEEFYEDDSAEAYVEYHDDDEMILDSLLSDVNFEEDMEVAEALATIMQKKGNASRKGKPSQEKGDHLPFRAHGEISFDKARDARKKAVQFLKQVTPCTTCGQKGDWSGDSECPKARSGKGTATAKKKPFAKKKAVKSSSSFYVGHGADEVQDYEEQYFVNHVVAEDAHLASLDGVLSQPKLVLEDRRGNTRQVKEKKVFFDNAFEFASGKNERQSTAETFVTFKNTDLCEHASSNGGDERHFHRAANGHQRQVMCKKDSGGRAVISAKRREPVQLWSFLVQVAMCTLWGTRARSRALFQRVTQVRVQALEEVEQQTRWLPGPPPGGYLGHTGVEGHRPSPERVLHSPEDSGR